MFENVKKAPLVVVSIKYLSYTSAHGVVKDIVRALSLTTKRLSPAGVVKDMSTTKCLVQDSVTLYSSISQTSPFVWFLSVESMTSRPKALPMALAKTGSTGGGLR